MKSQSQAALQRESAWPASYDDREIDQIIWSAIENSSSAGDFACYLVHRPQRAAHLQTAQIRYDAIDPALSTEPIGYFIAIEKIRTLAESGNPAALFHMGKIHAIGIAVKQDLVAAEAWYLKAIAQGEVRAHCNLGWMYQSGFGVTIDQAKAFRLLSVGANHGVSVARATIGVMRLSGEGCQADPKLGLQLLEEAFEAGYNNAGNCIADAYFAGQYLPKDIELAFEWLDRVVERGDARTMAILGHYLATGSHGRTDVARGLALLNEAIRLEYVSAYLWLGALYEKGIAVERDLGMAQTLFERGMAAGDEGCGFALMRMAFGALPAPELQQGLMN